MSVPPLPKLIGRTVRERYGRYEATIVAVETDDDNQPTTVVYENGGILVRSHPSCFQINDSEVEIAPPIVYEAEDVYKKMSVFMVREEALLNLREKGVVTEEIFEEVDGELEDAYETLLEQGNETIEKLEKRVKQVEERRDWIYRLLMDLEVVRQMKLASETDHASAYERLERELFTALNEADELKRLTIDVTSMIANIQEVRDQIETGSAEIHLLEQGEPDETPEDTDTEAERAEEEETTEAEAETSVELA
jgi:hypothetical protein